MFKEMQVPEDSNAEVKKQATRTIWDKGHMQTMTPSTPTITTLYFAL